MSKYLMTIPDQVPKPTELKISTMVCLCLLNIDINLDILSRFVRVYPVDDDVITKGDGGIVYVEYFLLLPRGQYCGKKSQVKKKELQINAKLRASMTNHKKYHNNSLGDISYQEPDPTKSKKKRKKKKGKRQFENQATLIFHFQGGRYVNIKVFHNGKIQMTGVRSVEEAQWVVSRLIEIIKETKVHQVEWKDVDKNESWLAKNQYIYTKIQDGATEVDRVYRLILVDQVPTWIEIPDETLKTFALGQPTVTDHSKLRMTDYQTVMINSNYSLGFNIDRAKLQEILKKKYNIYSTFESTYQAVKSYFYFNRDKKKIEDQDGVCRCKIPCFILKELKKKTPMPCSQVTISVFRTGSVIITGGSTLEQTKRAYDFINKVVHDNFKLIYQESDAEKEKKVEELALAEDESDPLSKLKKIMIDRANENRRRVVVKKKTDPKKPVKGSKRGRKPKIRYVNAFDIIDSPYLKNCQIEVEIQRR